MASLLPKSSGALAGWMMVAFIGGVAAHSSYRFWHLSPIVWTAIFFSFLILLFVRTPPYAKIAICIVFAFAIGLWRCDAAPMPKLRRIDDRLFISRSDNGSSWLGRWRRFVTARISHALPNDEGALVTGILYGDGDLSKTQRELFKSSGLMHIVAVSGSNVTVVVQFLSMAALGIGLRRRHAFWLTSAVLFLFVGFVGFAASVARAAFMGWLILLAREVGRIASPSRLLLVAATILLLIDPWQLFFDIGFALSFLAMWGLLAWAPLIASWLARLPNRFDIRTTLSMTLAATLMTAPYLAWMFQRISLAGIFTNVLALPIVPFVMGWGVLVGVWGSWPGSDIVSAPVLGMARVIEWIAGLSRLVPWLDLNVEKIKVSTLAATYALIAYLWFLLRAKKGLSTGRRVDPHVPHAFRDDC